LNKENNVYLLLPNQTETSFASTTTFLFIAKNQSKFNLNDRNIGIGQNNLTCPLQAQTLWG